MSKKIATIILTVIFMVIFIFVGIGSCGGVKYLINNRSERSLSNATVYAETVGGGSTNTVTDYISVTLNKYSFYVDGYRGNGFPNEYEGAEYMVVGDFRFTAVYENGNLQSFYVTTLQLMGYHEAGQYITEDLGYIDTDLTATNLVNIAFVNLYRGGIVVPGCLELASEQVIDLETCGDFVAVNVELIASDTTVGSFTLQLMFENDTYTYIVSPFGWQMYGDYEINKILNRFSYKEVFSLGSGNVAIDTTEYFMKGYDAAYNEFYQSRYDQGYSQGEQRGIEVGYAQGLSEANDYTFLSLISSAIDVPVKAFVGLTDFNFLGFNMSTFYKAIFGFAIIVIILRVLLP